MLSLYIGCKTEIPGYKDLYFNIEVEASTYPLKNERVKLAVLLNKNSPEIIDDVMYVVDKTTGEIIWEVD